MITAINSAVVAHPPVSFRLRSAICRRTTNPFVRQWATAIERQTKRSENVSKHTANVSEVKRQRSGASQLLVTLPPDRSDK